MSDENKRVDEEVEKTVEDLKKQIEEINREAEDAGSQQSSEVKEKIEAAAKKAIEILTMESISRSCDSSFGQRYLSAKRMSR